MRGSVNKTGSSNTDSTLSNRALEDKERKLAEDETKRKMEIEANLKKEEDRKKQEQEEHPQRIIKVFENKYTKPNK